MFEDKFLKLLSDELITALGCTEPIAIALAAAVARKHARGNNINEIKVFASTNIIKNAMAVNIPGTERSGINLAAALGALSGQPERYLEVLANVNQEILEKANRMINQGKVTVELSDSDEKLYIEVIVNTEVSSAKAVIEKTHTNITMVEVDGKVVSANSGNMIKKEKNDISYLSLESIWDFINNVSVDKLSLVKQSVELNRSIGEEGLKNSYGLQVGKTILDNVSKGILANDITNYAMALTSAGSDARMAGCQLKVMSNSGSGNQGITATLPVVAFWERLGLDEERLYRACALSHLITIYIKLKFGRLSSLCGAAIAATGASCGIVLLLGGGFSEIESAIQNMSGSVTGMLCDGAKAGCALKVSACTSAAAISALMAVDGRTIQPTDGIIEKNPEKTIENICVLSSKGTIQADKIILSIMLNKDLKNVS
ncbi:MAG: L-serine ammonia-lyase, iron-sulfur-dependent, subunit alpha [Clostridiaceae bacterium]